MKSLKRKILFILLSILTSVLFCATIVYNVSIYNREYARSRDIAMRIASKSDRIDERPMFFEAEIIIVKTNTQGRIVNALVSENINLTEEQIENLLAEKLRYNAHDPEESLYTNEYITYRVDPLTTVIINNQKCRKLLIDTVRISILISIILEAVFVFISIMITKWVTDPIEDAFNKQKQFIYDASHELKTPIAIISGSLEAYQRNPEEQKWLKNIEEENNHMSKLVSNLLHLSKTENKDDITERKKQNLSKTILSSALSFEPILFENSITLKTQIEESITYDFDKSQIQELMSILLDNARKYSHKNTEVLVGLTEAKDDIVVQVANTGAKIPDDQKEKIFDRFYRIDKSRNRESDSCGLGLSIAKLIVSEYGGKIWVETSGDKNIFTFTLKK